MLMQLTKCRGPKSWNAPMYIMFKNMMRKQITARKKICKVQEKSWCYQKKYKDNYEHISYDILNNS